MNTLPSIRKRLSLNLLLMALLWWLAISTALVVVVRHEIHEVLDNALQESAAVLVGVVPTGGDGVVTQLPTAADGETHLAWQVVAPGGRVLQRSSKAPETPFVMPPVNGFSDAGGDWRVFGLPVPDKNGHLFYVAQEQAERVDAQTEAMEYTAAVVLVIVVIGALWWWHRLGRELEPLGRLSAAVSGFDPFDKNAALPPPLRAELQPMHAAITGLGERLARKVRNERAFSAHAAHALRTPLAGMDAQLAVALREVPAEGQGRLLRARAAATRLQQVVTALLGLFRSSEEPRCRVVNVAALLAHLPASGVRVEAVGEESVWADPDLLAGALANLLDNAERHGAHAVTVEVWCEADGKVLSLQDDGPGIEESRRLSLQSALDGEDYTRQTGLGLMLADRVARSHGGHLSLPAVVGKGCRVEMHLPGPCREPAVAAAVGGTLSRW